MAQRPAFGRIVLLGGALVAYLIGVPAFWVLILLVLARRGWPLHLYARLLFVRESGEGGV